MLPTSRHPWTALTAGAAGAVVLTVIHETARRVVPDAPRMDRLGRRALTWGLDAADLPEPSEDAKQGIALVGDLVANSLAYALVGTGHPHTAPVRGAVVGGALGAVSLVSPPVLGLGPGPSRQRNSTQAMTLAWYVAGGVAAGLAYRWLVAGRTPQLPTSRS